MGTQIYYRETSVKEEWIDVNDDGSVTHVTENSGWAVERKGIDRRTRKMTADEAKEKWPEHADKIDEAIAKLPDRGAGSN
jgi:hypothetical protein